MIPLAVPDLSGNERKYLNDCIDTTFVSSVGEYVNRFEKMVANATGSRFAVATSSGTTGIHAALTAVGVSRDDLVIVPSFTFIASANAIRHCGADPWLIDIDINDWCLSPALVRYEIDKCCLETSSGLIHKNTGRRVAAIMPVYTLGNIPEMSEFRAISEDYNLPLVVDAACAIGATYKDDPIGKLADLTILSFNGNKTITCGGGGAVVGDDEILLNHVRHLTTTARVWPDYDFDEVGFNYRMTNVQAAIGCAQMERLDDFVESKRNVRCFYENSLERFMKKGISIFPTTLGGSCWLSGVVFSENYKLSDLKSIQQKMIDRGIDTRPFWKPVHLQKPYYYSPKSELPVSEKIWKQILTLPCSVSISRHELEYVISNLIELL